MAKIYSIGLTVYATAYIRASTPEEAQDIARDLRDTSLEVADAGGETPICGLKFDDPRLPDVSLSPAMTLADPQTDIPPECVHDSEDEPEPLSVRADDVRPGDRIIWSPNAAPLLVAAVERIAPNRMRYDTDDGRGCGPTAYEVPAAIGIKVLRG